MNAADSFVDELRLFYVDDFFFSPRKLNEGYRLSQIEAEIAAAKWLVVVSAGVRLILWFSGQVFVRFAGITFRDSADSFGLAFARRTEFADPSG